MSVSSTEMKFEVRYCASAKTRPPTTATGHAWRMPRAPSTMPIRISGTTSARKGVWRPTIAPRSSLGSPVISASVTIGMAIAPNATGAVLATRATEAALIGLKPSAISITAVMATGVPKPASASSSAPKQKAMMTACTRWSFETAPNERLRTAKYPVSTVML